MEILLINLVITATAYVYADNVKKKNKGIDVEPINYIPGGLLFGIFSIIYCWNKQRNFRKYNK